MQFQYQNCFEERNNNGKNRKYLILIIYDISDNKHRLKMVKLLESYGHRVQKSAFEALLDKKSLNDLVEKISCLTTEQDLVKVYCLKGVSETFTWGDIDNIEEDEIIFI